MSNSGFIGVQARWMEGKRSAVIWALALHAQRRRRLAVFGRFGRAPLTEARKERTRRRKEGKVGH